MIHAELFIQKGILDANDMTNNNVLFVSPCVSVSYCMKSSTNAFFVSFLPQRLQEDESRSQDLTQSVTSATRPLLRQIENLQATHNIQSAAWEKVEKNLTERLSMKSSFSSSVPPFPPSLPRNFLHFHSSSLVSLTNCIRDGVNT